MIANNFFRSLTYLMLLCWFVGCSAVPELDRSYDPPVPVQPVMAAATGGAIYQANTGLHLFEDLRAARVGDILTVRLVEQTIASKSSNTSTSKASEATLTNPTILGQPTTRNGVALFSGSLSGDQSFEGAVGHHDTRRLTEHHNRH